MRAGRPCSGTRSRASSIHDAQRVGADDLHDHVLAPPQVGRVAREADPAKRADAAREDRPHVLGDEARDLERILDPVRRGLRADAVAVLEDDGAALPVAEQRATWSASESKTAARKPASSASAPAASAGREAARHVARSGSCAGGLVGDDVELDAVVEKPRGRRRPRCPRARPCPARPDPGARRARRRSRRRRRPSRRAAAARRARDRPRRRARARRSASRRSPARRPCRPGPR